MYGAEQRSRLVFICVLHSLLIGIFLLSSLKLAYLDRPGAICLPVICSEYSQNLPACVSVVL